MIVYNELFLLNNFFFSFFYGDSRLKDLKSVFFFFFTPQGLDEK